MNFLDDEGIHNLENTIKAIEVDIGKSKRGRYGESSVKNKGERERTSRVAGNWPPEKEIIYIIIYQVNMHTWDQKEENLKNNKISKPQE
jgi:hypothetical protein